MCHLFAHQPQRGALLVAQIAGAQMLLPLPSRPMVRRCSSSNVRPATSRNYPSRFGKVRRCSGSSAGRPASWTASTIRPVSRRPTSPGTTPRLDAWLAKPEASIPRAIIAYRQPKAETRAAIIAYLKELN
jgi:cytochrome c